MQRNTIQRMLIVDSVMNSKSHPTAEEIYADVIKKCPNISLGTVYRNLNTLALEGVVLRVCVPNAPDRYDSTTHPHSHCRCVSCGKVSDFLFPPEAVLPVTENEDFTVRDYELIVNGWCRDCYELLQKGSE